MKENDQHERSPDGERKNHEVRKFGRLGGVGGVRRVQKARKMGEQTIADGFPRLLVPFSYIARCATFYPSNQPLLVSSPTPHTNFFKDPKVAKNPMIS